MKQQVINWLLKYLLCSIDVNQVITQNKVGLLMVNNEQLSNSEISNLQSEIKFLKTTRIWKILTETLKDQARQVMFERATTFDDMKNGKMMLYNIDVQEKIVEIIEQYKIR